MGIYCFNETYVYKITTNLVIADEKGSSYCVLFEKVFIYKNLLIRYTLTTVIHQVNSM